jgi:hypothetical protein
MISFENLHIVRVQQTAAANAFTMSDYICTKNLKRVVFIVSHAGANDTDLTIGLDEATAVAAGTHAAVTATVPIARDIDHGTSSDTLVRATDAASFVIDPATMGSIVLVMEWDPAKHTSGYDCIAVSGSGGHGSNTVTIFALGEAKYEQASLPTVITD